MFESKKTKITAIGFEPTTKEKVNRIVDTFITSEMKDISGNYYVLTPPISRYNIHILSTE